MAIRLGALVSFFYISHSQLRCTVFLIIEHAFLSEIILFNFFFNIYLHYFNNKNNFFLLFSFLEK